MTGPPWDHQVSTGALTLYQLSPLACWTTLPEEVPSKYIPHTPRIRVEPRKSQGQESGGPEHVPKDIPPGDPGWPLYFLSLVSSAPTLRRERSQPAGIAAGRKKEEQLCRLLEAVCRGLTLHYHRGLESAPDAAPQAVPTQVPSIGAKCLDSESTPPASLPPWIYLLAPSGTTFPHDGLQVPCQGKQVEMIPTASALHPHINGTEKL